MSQVSHVPRDWRPMLATLASEAPMGAEWSYEIKWDGIRGLVAVEQGIVSVTSRLGNDLRNAGLRFHPIPDDPDRTGGLAPLRELLWFVSAVATWSQ